MHHKGINASTAVILHNYVFSTSKLGRGGKCLVHSNLLSVIFVFSFFPLLTLNSPVPFVVAFAAAPENEDSLTKLNIYSSVMIKYLM